ncbi:hypothetical protein D8674_029458 [Pyrus ussuriensis x Pyrus communis]|uniref:Uncharacterized protein n=1 Tax=Pyrus ussuriensis x Pyrus communis TaxID=2448454 RepID=A0A5N5I3W9_9ROSA|nr:hypothetical protein D8674_029458 [Pyrus ussuriensis x Pyrus communis]
MTNLSNFPKLPRALCYCLAVPRSEENRSLYEKAITEVRSVKNTEATSSGEVTAYNVGRLELANAIGVYLEMNLNQASPLLSATSCLFSFGA